MSVDTPRVWPTDSQIEKNAAELREWFDAYVKAGFTEEQALELVKPPPRFTGMVELKMPDEQVVA